MRGVVRADGELPGALGAGEHLVVAEVVAVGEHAERRPSSPYSPAADLVHLAVRDEDDLVGRLPRLGDHLAGRELALLEPARRAR